MDSEQARQCAVCGAGEPLDVYTVSAGADTAVVILCPTDGEPIRELAALGVTSPNPSRGLRHAVIPID